MPYVSPSLPRPGSLISPAVRAQQHACACIAVAIPQTDEATLGNRSDTLHGMPRTTVTPRALELGLLIAQFRNRAGLSQTALAKAVGRSPSDISRIEHGKLRVDEPGLGAICGVLGVTVDELDRAVALQRDVANPNWMAHGVGRQLAMVTAFEDLAERIVNAQPSYIPGPLQRPEYAMSVIRAGGATETEAAKAVALRMARAKRILSGAVEFTAIIGEYALRYPACEPEFMGAQLAWLQTAAELPNVTVLVVDINKTYTALRDGSFVLIESGKTNSVVHLEQRGGSSTLTESKYVSTYQAAAKDLRRDAMTPVATTGLIADLIDKWSIQYGRIPLA